MSSTMTATPDTKKHRYRLQCWQVAPVLEQPNPELPPVVVGENGTFAAVDVSTEVPISETAQVQKMEADLTQAFSKQGPCRVIILGWTKYEDSGLLMAKGLLLPN